MTPPPKSLRAQPGGTLIESAQSMLVLTSIALFLLTFTIQPFRIPSASMEPTLLVGDFLLVDKQLPQIHPSSLPPTSATATSSSSTTLSTPANT